MPSTLHRVKESAVPRVVSVIVLVAILLLMGAVFFQVMANFVVPLFLAAVLVVVFKPLHAWVVRHIPGYPRLSALATTLLILLAVLLPTVWLGWKAALECRTVYTAPVPARNVERSGKRRGRPSRQFRSTKAANWIIPPPPKSGVNEKVRPRSPPAPRSFVKNIYETVTGDKFSEETIGTLLKNTRGAIGAFAVSGAQIVLKLFFGLVIMVCAVLLPRRRAQDAREHDEALAARRRIRARAARQVRQHQPRRRRRVAGVGRGQGLWRASGITSRRRRGADLSAHDAHDGAGDRAFAGAAAVWVPTAVWIYLYQPVYENGQAVVGQQRASMSAATPSRPSAWRSTARASSARSTM